MAFGCLERFVHRFLTGFFLKDNSHVSQSYLAHVHLTFCKVMQEFLAVFSHLVAYHDPKLAVHLDEIGFIPELYAIPWFETLTPHEPHLIIY